MIGIILIHPHARAEHAGYIPTFLDENDPRPACEQFHERYEYGGWRPMDGFTYDTQTFVLSYPGDPPFTPLVGIPFRKELILIYESDIVAIIQRDGSFSVARMD